MEAHCRFQESSITLSSVSPSTADTTPVNPTTVTVIGSGFKSVTDPLCVFDASGYRKGGYLAVPASVLSDTRLTCSVPGFPVASPVHLTVSANDGATQSSAVGFVFDKFVDAVGSLSSFTCGGSAFDSSTVDILVRVSSSVLPSNTTYQLSPLVPVDVSLAGRHLVSATVAANGTLHRIPVPVADVSAGECPFFAAVDVSLACPSCIVSARASEVSVEGHPYMPNQVLVDRATGGLVVGGDPFFPYGYFVDGKEDLPVVEAALQDMAHRGMNTFMPYMCTNEATVPPCVRLDAAVQLMDKAQALGLKVQLSLLAITKAIMSSPTDPSPVAFLQSVIDSIHDHPALLGYYLTDDTVALNASLVSQLYSIVHAADPLHPVFNTNNNWELIWHYAQPGQVGFDFTLYEEYDLANPAAVPDSNAMPHYWPMSFAAGGLCAQGFADDQTTTAAVRLQTYSALVAGGTAVMPWDWWQWSNLDSRSVWVSHVRLAAEVQEIASGILSSVLNHPTVDITGVSSGAKLTGRAFQRDDGAVYIVVINLSQTPVQFTVSAPFIHSGSAGSGYSLLDVLWEGRTLNVSTSVSPTTWTESVGAWGTRTYLFTPGLLRSSSLTAVTGTPPAPGSNWVANAVFDSTAPTHVNAWMTSWKFFTPTDDTTLDQFDLMVDPLVRGPTGQRSLRINTRGLDNPFGFAFVPAPLVAKQDVHQQYVYSVNVRIGLPVPYSTFNITLCGAVYPYEYPLTSAKGFTAPLILGADDSFAWHTLSATMYPDETLKPGVCVMGTGPVWIENYKVVHP